MPGQHASPAPCDPVQCKLDRLRGPTSYLVKVNVERRRRAEATEEWCKRYDIRAGI